MSTKTAKYPEHEKLKARESDALLLSGFLDFIMHDQCWFIAEYDSEGDYSDRLYPIRLRQDEIIGLFPGIDPKKLEAEKRAMLEERNNLREQNERLREALRLAANIWVLGTPENEAAKKAAITALNHAEQGEGDQIGSQGA